MSSTTKVRLPEEIIKDLAPAYKEWKGGEKDKNKLKTEFFESITDRLREVDLADRLVEVEGQDEKSASENAERNNPTWVVVDLRPSEKDGWYEVIMEENPEFQTFIIEYDGQVWGRQVVEGATMLDDDRIAIEDPNLYKVITAYPNQSLLEDIAYEAGMDPNDHEFEMDGFTGFDGYIEWQCERHGVKRSLKPLDELPDEVAAQLQPYLYPGPPQIKFPAPKKAKT